MYFVSLFAVGNPKISTYSDTSLICSVWDPYQAFHNTLALAFHWHEPWKDRVANPDNPSSWQKFESSRFFHPGIPNQTFVLRHKVEKGVGAVWDRVF